jgi:hypothetical protein
MPSANKTPNYNLTQYSNNGSDKISALQDYNEDMSKIDTALNDNANNIATKADKATTYSKTDVDNKLDTKADTTTVDTKLAAKADTDTTYSKTDVDTKIAAKADAATAYHTIIVDNSGATDVSDKIQQAINSPFIADIYLPTGNYLISKTINISDATKSVSIKLHPAAKIFTEDALQAMLAIDAPNTLHQSVVIDGGVWDGSMRADDILKINTNYNVVLKNMRLQNAVSCHIDGDNATCMMIDNIDIWGGDWIGGDAGIHNVGIRHGHDCQISNVRIMHIMYGFEPNGYSQYSNIYVYGGNRQEARVTAAFHFRTSWTTCQITNMYADTLQNVFLDDAGVAGTKIYGSGIFWVTNKSEIDDTKETNFLNTSPSTIFNVSNMSLQPVKVSNFSKNTLNFSASVNFAADSELNMSQFSDIPNIINAGNRFCRIILMHATSSNISGFANNNALRIFSIKKAAGYNRSYVEIMSEDGGYYAKIYVGYNGVGGVVEKKNPDPLSSNIRIYKTSDQTGDFVNIYLINGSTTSYNHGFLVRFMNGNSNTCMQNYWKETPQSIDLSTLAEIA